MTEHIVEFTEFIAKAYMDRWFMVADIIKLEDDENGDTRRSVTEALGY